MTASNKTSELRGSPAASSCPAHEYSPSSHRHWVFSHLLLLFTPSCVVPFAQLFGSSTVTGHNALSSQCSNTGLAGPRPSPENASAYMSSLALPVRCYLAENLTLCLLGPPRAFASTGTQTLTINF